ncbi:MAG: hypothetical protein LBP55_06220 [Candidatus Adiutrix sp.]|nr:hypothetical protein [Candidatus Adiutrix sp.]
MAIKWLATYISVRPTEMRTLTEAQVDRKRGLLIIPHPKEKRPKIVPLTAEDRDILSAIPHNFDQHAPFFRHERNGEPFGVSILYKAWKRACKALGITGVDLYGGTKHSTAMGVRAVATFEEVRLMTGHTTNKAFERYFRTEGAALESLYAKRKAIVADNQMTTDFSLPQSAK